MTNLPQEVDSFDLKTFFSQLRTRTQTYQKHQTIFEQGKSAYGGGAWSTQIVKLLEDTVGTDLRAPGFPAKLET